MPGGREVMGDVWVRRAMYTCYITQGIYYLCVKKVKHYTYLIWYRPY